MRSLVPAALLGGLTILLTSPGAAAPPKEDAVARARAEAMKLDHIYKNAIVVITTDAVDEEGSIPAGTMFKKVFAAARAKGYHEARLIDATGEPYDDVNAPRDDFEKEAVRQLLKGNATHERVVASDPDWDGRPTLKVATAIPVVMDKCVMCHANYEGTPEGQAIGALSYTIPLE